MKASIILPTYNRGVKLAQAVESIQNSNFPKKDFEIIIINDNSEDNTEIIVKTLKKKYKNINYIKNEKNLGPASSRNVGIKLAKGKYIFFTDDDCIVPDNWIKKYVEFFGKNKDVGGIGGLLEPAEKNVISKIELLKDKILKIKSNKMIIGKEEVPVGFTNNMSYRKEVFSKIGFFNEKFKAPAGEDSEFKKRVAKKFKLAFIPIKVIHNHNYNLDYLLSILYRQGLEKNPPKNKFMKLIILIFKSPVWIYNILKKTFMYRRYKR
ncbi:MAG: glycosyltransferase family A protein [archaeon]